MKQYPVGPPRANDKSASFCHIWKLPESSTIVQLNVSFLNRLSAQVYRYAGEAPLRAGLLLGRVISQADQVIAVEEYEPCQLGEEIEGSLCTVSESLQQASLRWSAFTRKHLYQVGCYLVGSGDSLRPTKAEKAIVSRALDGSNQTLLTLRPNLGEAALFVAIHGGIADDAPYYRIRLTVPSPRNTAVGSLEAPNITSIVPEQVGRQQIEAADPDYLATRAKNGRSRSVTRPIGIAALALGFVAAGLWWVQANGRSVPATPNALVNDLRLEAAQNDRSLRISWNIQSAAIQKAQSGSVKIEDGPLTRNVALEISQLKGGRIIYIAQTDDVKIALEVSTRDNIAYRDSMRVVNGSISAYSVDHLPEAIHPALPHSTQAEIRPIMRTESKQAPVPKDGISVRNARISEKSPVTESLPTRSGEVTPGEARVAAIAGSMPREPVFTSADVSAPLVLHPLAELSGPNPQAISGPSAQVTRPHSVENRSTAPIMQPAKLVQYRTVSVPESIKRMVTGGMTISLQILIDENGKVQKVNSGPETNAFKTILVNIYSAAAKTWQYEPARRDGRPVPGVVDLQLRYNPATGK